MSYNNKLSECICNNPLKNQIKKELDPQFILDCMKKSFTPFFENTDNLNKYANPYLIPIALGYCKNYYDKIDSNIEGFINILHEQKNNNRKGTFELLQKELFNYKAMSEKACSSFLLQRNIEELELPEKITEIFRFIEDSLENELKVYLYTLLRLKEKNIQNKHLTFGQCIAELKKDPFLNSFLTIDNKKISLSQLRNIACHKDYSINSEKIICQYGKKIKKEIIFQNYNELVLVSNKIHRLCITLKIAFDIFIFDNFNETIGKIDKQEFGNSRKEIWLNNFICSIFIYGFKVDNVEKKDGKLVIEVKDLTKGNIKERSIQSSKIIYLAWFYSSEKIIEVIYKNNENISIFKTSANDDICKKICSKEKTINYLAENMDIIILNPYIFNANGDNNGYTK